MKTCIVQPAYCLDFSESDKFFEWEIEALEKCDESMDLIVLPEYSNVPCLAKTKEEKINKNKKRILFFIIIGTTIHWKTFPFCN